MLGRQQIAGIPTAIHELFKNAHDAYANRVEVDYFRADDLLVLRDDGYGMSREEFEKRWLTIGTEAKVGANNDLDSPIPEGMTRRPIMGEKGIGRLAIAAVGPQVLVLTRAGKTRPVSNLVVCLIHWGLFELPGIDLAQIDIPIVELPGGTLPDRALVHTLVDAIRANLHALGGAVAPVAKARIEQELVLADFDIDNVARKLRAPSLADDGCGTHFYVRPANPILRADIDGKAEDAASPLEKMLLGFSNTMMPERAASQFDAEFRDHREDGVVDELIGGSTFFTPEEFNSADHHVQGRFDEFGQFSGTVAVYDQPAVPHKIVWPEAAGRQTECGPFRIAFGYVQGLAKDSRLPPDEWALISAKLNRIGGLYVYRDGIRILPYGNSDYDFLNIERRRTKSAQDWYFSYRRIMGAIEISYQDNFNLVEKAGREGFRANVAYRQMTNMLENFFSRLAIDFFRPNSVFGTEFNAQKAALNREVAVLARREGLSRKRRQDFTARLATFFDDLEGGKQAFQTKSLLEDVRSRLRVASNIADPDRASAVLLEIEQNARAGMRSLVESSKISKPRGLGLSRAVAADWNAYLKNFDKLETDIFEPVADEIFSLIGAAGKQRGLDERRRLSAGLEARKQGVTGDATRLRREVKERVTELSENVDEAIRTSISQLSIEIEGTFAEFNRTNTSSLSDMQLRSLQSDWEHRIDASALEAQNSLEGLRDQLMSLTGAVKQRETLDEVTGALEGQVEAYREQLDSYVELAQVGMALGIVQHEFSNSVRSIKGVIRRLKPWAAGTPDLNELYTDLKTSFEHLETYLGLFAPMSRRLNRSAVDLSGEEIRNYLDEVFGDRLHRHKVVITATPNFLRKSVHVYASNILPVFVNLVDNAIYWMTTVPRGRRHILLDADARSFVVANTGPGIDRRISSRIFDFGETTKPGGRGMGLYLSRQALLKEGYDISLMQEGSEFPVAFRIGRSEKLAELA
ncbi:ATP-binding protein [Mesorhizobium sp. WSM4307]|uniref:ATP-binding protein n=1 Tax=unclassified Mesorhizobium TaxID=325217 RepID=UPI00115E656D|nr:MULTISPECIES: ATP-binding protein [unclassified Mesorhizobium]TRC77471.1 ATP-binding protein [Mesorhizobium sp. WSM4315]TRC80112.1 ATP-binding protein [Mesorhizobium sp. WSM4307]